MTLQVQHVVPIRPIDDGFSDWATARVKFNNAKEAVARRPTVCNLGPPVGAVVEVELRPRDCLGAEPIAGKNRADSFGNFYFKAPVALPSEWPDPQVPELPYEVRWRAIDEAEIGPPRPARATRGEVESLRVRLSVAHARIAELNASSPLAEMLGEHDGVVSGVGRPDQAMVLIDRVFRRLTGADVLASVRAYHRLAPGWVPSEIFDRYWQAAAD